jgi:23S rRNA pseudouridine1911/1915/1917 synthase
MLENYPEYIEKVFQFSISTGQKPERLDSFLANSIRNASRTKVQKAIDAECVTINGKPSKAGKKIQPGDVIICKILKPPPIELVPENIPLNIVFEDEHLLVVNKPAGMVTHPAFGNRYGTLVNAVLYHLGMRQSITFELDDEDEDENETAIFESSEIRPGVVHRLDKNTSGLLVVSKNPVIHAGLAKQFFDRTVDRSYNSIVWGIVKQDSGTIEGNIGRANRDRKLFDVVKREGKHAITDYKVLERYDFATFVQIKLRTGRTHQIRVHFRHIGHPVLGDPEYGGDKIHSGGGDPIIKKRAEKCLKLINRQMLHARTLGFVHPATKEKLSFTSELPEDMENILDILRKE